MKSRPCWDVMTNLQKSSSVCTTKSIKVLFLNLSRSIALSTHYGDTISEQLSQINNLLLLDETNNEIQKQCDFLLNYGAIKMIIKLLESTTNKEIINECVQLGNTLLSCAVKHHYVTYDYVCTVPLYTLIIAY